jgi:hypothetical protein
LSALQLIWLLLVSYAAGLHLLALVRGTHYFTLDQGHVIFLLAKRLRVVSMFSLWWALLLLWPLPMYFIALSPNAGEWLPGCSSVVACRQAGSWAMPAAATFGLNDSSIGVGSTSDA